MASLTQWTRIWANSRRSWRTGKPGMLRSRGHKESDMTSGLNSNSNKIYLEVAQLQYYPCNCVKPCCLFTGLLHNVTVGFFQGEWYKRVTTSTLDKIQPNIKSDIPRVLLSSIQYRWITKSSSKLLGEQYTRHEYYESRTTETILEAMYLSLSQSISNLDHWYK